MFLWPTRSKGFFWVGLLASLSLGCKIRIKKPAGDAISQEKNAGLYFQNDEPEEKLHLLPPFKIGSSAATFTPPLPTALAGFGGFPRRVLLPRLEFENERARFFHPYTKIESEPRIKVVVLGGSTAKGEQNFGVLLSLDAVFVPADLSKKIAAAVRETAKGKGVEVAAVTVAATHTHSGFSGLSELPLWEIMVSDIYSADTAGRLLAAVRQSVADALTTAGAVSSLVRREGEISDISELRWPGTFFYHRSMQLQFRADGGDSPLACLVTYPVHGTWFGSEDSALSSDVPGHIEKSFSSTLGGKECYFFNGAEGNISPVKIASITRYADAFVAQVKAQPEQKENLNSVVMGSFIVNLPEARLNKIGCEVSTLASALLSVDIFSALPHVTKVSYLRLNNLLWLFLPGEPIAELQAAWEPQLRAAVPGISEVRVLSTSNDYIGYIVSEELYAQPHIESCSSYYGPELAARLLGQILIKLPAALR